MVVANKSDLTVHTDFHYDSLEARVIFDWENGYVECSAKENKNVTKIFKELLNQAKPRYGVSIPVVRFHKILSVVTYLSVDLCVCLYLPTIRGFQKLGGHNFGLI